MRARHDGLAASVLRLLGVALFEESDGRLSLASDTPEWLSQVWNTHEDGSWDFGGPFSYLDNFLEDCRVMWAEEGDPASLTSEPWTQPGRNGGEIGLRALGLREPGGRRLLAVELLGASHEFSRRALQRAHERGMENHRLELQAMRLSARNEETERLNQLKRDFLAQMSHELRTPLNSISGFSTLLLQGKAGELNAKQETYVSNVMTAAGHLQNLIDDVMDLSRIEAGHFPLSPSVCDAEDVGAELAVLLEQKAATKSVEFVIAMPSGNFTFSADRVRLLQILGNLAGNAIKFTPSGGSVRIEGRPLEDRVQFRVTDTGPGISATELPHIFEKFQQYPRPGVTGNRGAGLGLAIAKGLVDLHRGELAVESALGQGSTFVVTLPV